MSNLKVKIEKDFVTAFKEKNTLKKNTLGMLKSKITEFEKKANSKAITDSDVLGIISSEIKKRQQTLDMIKDNASENAYQTRVSFLLEMEYLKEYLPKQLTDEELKTMVSKFIVDNFIFSDPANARAVFGAVMGEFNKNYKGQFDGKKLKEITEKILEL